MYMNLKRIGLNIKYFRQSAGLSQKELADKIETSWEMVSRYETGKSSPMRRIMSIAEALGVSLDTLFAENSLSESKQTYHSNSIPLLDKQFSNISEALRTTKSYYTAPDWVVGAHAKPFAVASDIVHLETAQISANGIIYAVREKPSSSKDIILIQKGPKIIATTYSSSLSAQKILGVVIGFEKRFR